MLEWLILMIVVPAVVVPVVLLAGFAGCDRVFGLQRTIPAPPIITVSEGTGLDTTALAWTFTSSFTTFEIERTKLPDEVPDPVFEVNGVSLDDTGLEPGTIYQYRVRAILANGEESTDWSAPATAKTFSFYTTFEWKNYEEVFSRDVGGWAGFCIIQRIEAGRLTKSGGKVRVTLRASSTSGAWVRRVYISRPSGDSSRDPYDPDVDLIPIVTAPLTIAANTSLLLPLVDYNLDENLPLLIAIDFDDSPPSGIRTSDHADGSAVIHVPPDEARTFFKPAAEAAAEPERTGFDPTPGINFVYKIEVVAP
jgi:hypothetical protein